MRVGTTDEHDQPVLDYWRCPMIPLRNPDVDTGHADDMAKTPQELDLEQLSAALPPGWRLDRLRAAVPGPYFDELALGQTLLVDAGETVTSAPELARLTLTAHATRAIPAIATIVAWHGCEHLGPVFEGDVLRTELTVENCGGGLAGLRARVSADRVGSEPVGVLDRSFEAVVA